MLYNVVVGSENNMGNNNNLRNYAGQEPRRLGLGKAFFPLTVASFQPEVKDDTWIV
jgi:hypothetical protein